MRRGLVLATLSLAFAVVHNPQLEAIDPGPVPQWIWCDRLPQNGQIGLFRHTFSLSKPVRAAWLTVLADDHADVAVNGKAVAQVRDRAEPPRVDVTAALVSGENLIAVRGENRTGPAGVLVRLDIEFSDGQRKVEITDPRWQAAAAGLKDWQKADLATGEWGFAASHGLLGVPPWGAARIDVPEYHQWKQALGAEATAAAAVAAVPGFEVTLVRASQPGEGSWISLELDPKGRLIIGREGPGLLRYTLPAGPTDPDRMETINNTLLECRGLLCAHDALYASANNSKGLYRLKDTDGDDTYDEVRLLKAIGGGVGHGRNDLALGPDGMIYLICGNDVQLLGDIAASSPLKNYADDRLTHCDWDRFLFDRNAKMPAGHVLRTDRDGSKWELVAGGMRNPYGLDFSPDGHLFTFDADNEGDAGAPWYRPTRINHIVPGADFGWRQGSGIRPAWFPDNATTTLDIGKASPTGVKFGTGSNFPAPYRSALFVMDWSYGLIYAVHLLPRGSSFAATAEVFLAGRPLNVTDLEFGTDGAMYFTTGGRGTQSGLYRVRWTGSVPPPPNTDTVPVRKSASTALSFGRQVRSAYHFSHLGSADLWLRQGARLVWESHSPADLAQDALQEDDPSVVITALMALARIGGKVHQPSLLNRLCVLPLAECPPDPQLTALRAIAISLARDGMPEGGLAQRLRDKIEPLFPAKCHPVNQLACELLVALKSPLVVTKTMPLLETASTQEEQLCWLFLLRNVTWGWTPAARQLYFSKLHAAEEFEGGRELPVAIYSIRAEAVAGLEGLPTDERQALSLILAPKVAVDLGPTKARAPVQEWTLETLVPKVAVEPRDPVAAVARGRQIFREALCVRCHRVGKEGMTAGPDLTGVSLRFSRRDLLDSVINPSKQIDEKYRNQRFETKSGKLLTGRVITGDKTRLLLSTDPLAPDQILALPLDDIQSESPSPTSPMPVGLLNTFEAEEVRDLLLFFEAAAKESR